MTFPNDNDPNQSSDQRPTPEPSNSEPSNAPQQTFNGDPNRPFVRQAPQRPQPYPPQARPQYRPLPPQPPRFWQIVLKDIAATIVGVGFFCIMVFIMLIAAAGMFVRALDGIDAKSDAFIETTISGDDNCAGKIVVLPIEGVIETDESGFIPEAIEAIREDNRVRALVLRVNSPGGTISGSDYYLHLLKELKKDLEIPVIVSMGDVAASGGYYISTVGDKIFAERSTVTGSIGVIVSMYNAAELCKKLGVSSNAITSGAMKDMGDFMKEPTPEETAIWQKNVDDSYEQFLSVIREGRPWYRGEDDLKVIEQPTSKRLEGVKVKTIKDPAEEIEGEQIDEQASEQAPNAENAELEDAPELDVAQEDADEEKEAENADANETKDEAIAENAQNADTQADADVVKERDTQLRKLADGRIYSAQDAKELHLIDEIGFLDDAIDAAIEAIGLSKGQVQVVRYEEEIGVFESIVGGVSSKAEPMNKALETIASPRGYYMIPRALP